MNKRLLILNFLLMAMSVCILLIPAFKNGYPLLYSDSATYIVAVSNGAVPIDRPMLYCFLVRHLSLSYSLWLIVIVQSLVFVWLTVMTLKQFLDSKLVVICSFIVCMLLSFLTGASNYLSQIMPDVFSGFLIWALALLLVVEKRNERISLIILVIVSAMVHFSNLLTATGLSLVLLILLSIFKNRILHIREKAVNLALIFVLPWILIPSFNFIFDKEFYLNKSSNVFFTGRLIETKILSDFFENQPEAKKYSLYAVKDRIPEKAWQFLWNNDSPLYDGDCSQHGGWSNCWKVHSSEYGKMIKEILTTPSLLKKFIWISVTDWKNQLFDFDIGHLTPQGKGSGFEEIISLHFDDFLQYRTAKQYSETLYFEKESKLQRWTIGLSIFIIVLLFINLAKIKYVDFKLLIIILITMIAGILLNGLFCSVFSGVLNRYQGRVIWLIPIFALSLLFILVSLKLQQREKQV